MAEGKSLSGKVIVITGASSGFGKGAAREFAKADAAVVLAARRESLLQALAQECTAAGGRALAIVTDVSQQDDVQRLAETAIAHFGHVDVWVNDAGVGAVGRFDEIPLADHVQVISTDLLGTIYGSHFALRHFRQRGAGTLINVASALGKIPAPYYSSYAAAKFGIVGLCGALRQELRENNETEIHVCTVMPMAMDTPFFVHASNYSGHEVVPIPPLYDPQKVIDVIVHLATKPEDEVIVGAAGKLAAAAHGVMPGFVESQLGHTTHKTQMQKSTPAPNSKGAVFEPMSAGADVAGGWANRK